MKECGFAKSFVRTGAWIPINLDGEALAPEEVQIQGSEDCSHRERVTKEVVVDALLVI
jgi:hypothetical protein